MTKGLDILKFAHALGKYIFRLPFISSIKVYNVSSYYSLILGQTGFPKNCNLLMPYKNEILFSLDRLKRNII